MAKIPGSPFGVFAQRPGKAPLPAAPARKVGAIAEDEAGGTPLCTKCAAKIDPGWAFCPACGQAVGRSPDDTSDEDDDEDDDEAMAAAKAKATRRCLAIHRAGVRLGIPKAARILMLDNSLRRSQAIALLETLAATRGSTAGQPTPQARTSEAAAFVLRAATDAGLMVPDAKPGNPRRIY